MFDRRPHTLDARIEVPDATHRATPPPPPCRDRLMRRSLRPASPSPRSCRSCRPARPAGGAGRVAPRRPRRGLRPRHRHEPVRRLRLRRAGPRPPRASSRHYYTGTQVGKLSTAARRGPRPAADRAADVTFSGATGVAGGPQARARRSGYVVTPRRARRRRPALARATARSARYGSPLRVTGGRRPAGCGIARHAAATVATAATWSCARRASAALRRSTPSTSRTTCAASSPARCPRSGRPRRCRPRPSRRARTR